MKIQLITLIKKIKILTFLLLMKYKKIILNLKKIFSQNFNEPEIKVIFK